MHPTTSLNITIVMVLIFSLLCRAEDHHKRIPTGFTGTRGKKSITYSDEIANNNPINGYEDGVDDGGSDSLNIEKRAPSGFMGMRGKKPFPVWMENDAYPDGIYKRAPSGFMGMRGKKDIEFPSFDEEYGKRAPSGFMGMRGKKTTAVQDRAFDNDFYYKRAPMGFVGMRGKKTTDALHVDEKRAPSGFFGMRGKKQPRQSGFFGMRGKKFPYELRGKFVGVRGKKIPNQAITTPAGDFYPNYEHDLDMQQLLYLLTNQQDNNGDNWNSIDFNDSQ